MCGTCHCHTNPEDGHLHTHRVPHHGQPHDPLPHAQTLVLGERLLAKNDHRAADNRRHFRERGWLVLNVLSSPGSGKTTLVARLGQDWPQPNRCGVIVGDLATDHDAQRLRAAGLDAVQITTGTVCHLDAAMIQRALDHWPRADLDLLVIENVGNLVCPADFDLGETLRVVLLAVTEGEDKPLKYPTLFKTADLVLITKMDLAAAVAFDLPLARHYLHQIAPHAQSLPVSARTGEGLAAWYAWLHGAQAGRQVLDPSGDRHDRNPAAAAHP